MADKTPVRVVFNSSNVATGMAEFQSGETISTSHGGTGLSSIGTAGQVLKVNAAANGLEFGAEGDISITNLVAPTNADLTFTTSGTGGIILNDITISDNSISTNRSNDDFKINASGTGTVVLENLKVGTSGSTVTTILDEDNLSTNSATALATQQSIKAYVDSEVSAVSTTSISTGDSNVTVVDSGTGNVTIEVDGTDRLTTVAATTTTATGHSLVIGAGSNSAGGSIKFLEGTDNGTNGVTLLGPASTADVTVTLPAATDTLVGKATTDTFTNKTFDVEGTGNSISNIDVADLKSGVLDTDLTSVSGSDDTLASAKAIKTYVDSQVTAQDLDFATDDSTALNIDLDSETLQVSGGANITTSGSSNTITITLDTSLTGLTSVTSTALVTNSISSSDSSAVRIDDALNVDGALDVGAGFTISNGQSITSILDEDAMGSDSANALATQQSIKAYANTKATLSGSTDNTIATVTGANALQGEANLTFDGSTFAVTGGATISTTLGVTGASTLDGVTISDNKVSANASNSVLQLASSGTGDVEVDAGGDIILDADNADVILKDAGVEFGRLSSVSSDLVIKSATSDKDMLFKGNDGGATITALTLDMSEAGAATFNDVIILGTNKEIQFVDTNESIKSDGSKLIVKSGGTTFNLPTADGTDGQSLVTDGSGTLSFGTVGDPDASDDTNASALANKRITTTARAIDSFGETFQDSVLYYVCTNDHHLDTINLQKVSLVHNDTAPFISTTGVASGTGDMTTFTTDTSNNVVRLKAASTNAVGGNVSYYKIGLGDNSTAATSGNIIVTQNTDVDSASEAITSFAHADFRGAKLFISVNNDSKTEVTNMEGLVVHDGTNAFITTYNVVNSGNNTLATFTAAISGDNVVISGAGLEPNLRITVHAIMLKDTMTANAGTYANSEAIAPVTISSSATSFDTFAQKTTNGAVYFLVSKNAAEGHYAINEILVAFGSDNITHANAGFVSTKGTNQIAVTSEIKDDTEFTGDIKISSTSGASTTVSAYMIKLHAS